MTITTFVLIVLCFFLAFRAYNAQQKLDTVIFGVLGVLVLLEALGYIA